MTRIPCKGECFIWLLASLANTMEKLSADSNQWQVCPRADSCGSDVDHGQALLAELEHLERWSDFKSQFVWTVFFHFRK